MISSRTPEGIPNECPVCGKTLRIEPSTVPMRDAPCPNCGCLLIFEEPDSTTIRFGKALPLDVFTRLGERTREVPQELIFDCEGLDFFSSELLSRMTIVWRKALLSGNRMALCNVGKELREILQLTKLDQVIEIR